MARASDFYIGANDEHGMNPPTVGKRTPVMPHLNRVFYENEFNAGAKHFFILACLRCGFRVYDVKPENNGRSRFDACGARQFERTDASCHVCI